MHLLRGGLSVGDGQQLFDLSLQHNKLDIGAKSTERTQRPVERCLAQPDLRAIRRQELYRDEAA
jgi:hypothetical protein